MLGDFGKLISSCWGSLPSVTWHWKNSLLRSDCGTFQSLRGAMAVFDWFCMVLEGHETDWQRLRQSSGPRPARSCSHCGRELCGSPRSGGEHGKAELGPRRVGVGRLWFTEAAQKLHRSPMPGRRRVKALFIHDQAIGICTRLHFLQTSPQRDPDEGLAHSRCSMTICEMSERIRSL